MTTFKNNEHAPELARMLVPHELLGVDREEVTAALQKLMDERDDKDLERALWQGEAERDRQRAEAAEAKLAELVRRVRLWNRDGLHGGPLFSALERILEEFEAKS